MSYRTTVNGAQLFGNNEYYQQWIDFVKSQGIAVDPDGNYDGEIKDFMGALEACEAITMSIEAERMTTRTELDRMSQDGFDALPERLKARGHSLFDLSGIKDCVSNPDPKETFRRTLFDELYERIRYGYLFLPFLLYSICQDALEQDDSGQSNRLRAYRIKPGKTIKIHAG